VVPSFIKERTMCFIDELNEMADEEFDADVFAGADGDELLETYNSLDGAPDLLYEITNEMASDAAEAARKAMRDVLNRRKGKFISTLRQRWACPDCSDQFEDKYVMLDRVSLNEWQCPSCGCSTSAPEEDACYDMTDWED